MDEEFRILRIRELTACKRDVKGFVDLQIGPVTILGIKIITCDGQTFCAMPSEDFHSKSAGRTLSRAIVHLEEELKFKVYEAILEEWSRMQLLKFNNGEG